MATKKEALEKRIEALRAKLGEEVAKEKQAVRKAETRRKIQFGALLLADESDAAKKLTEKYRKVIEDQEKAREAKKTSKEKPVT